MSILLQRDQNEEMGSHELADSWSIVKELNAAGPLGLGIESRFCGVHTEYCTERGHQASRSIGGGVTFMMVIEKQHHQHLKWSPHLMSQPAHTQPSMLASSSATKDQMDDALQGLLYDLMERQHELADFLDTQDTAVPDHGPPPPTTWEPQDEQDSHEFALSNDPASDSSDSSDNNLDGHQNYDVDDFLAAGIAKAHCKHSASDPDNHEWYPWHDKIICTLDILMHLPCSVFSEPQLNLFLWILHENDVNDVPTVNVMKNLNHLLQELCGIETIDYEGAHGNRYSANSLSQIIAQEMANPRVRPHLSFYPEDAGKRLCEACQACRWLQEIPDEDLGPMARIKGDDYYIHEPTMLYGHLEVSFCIPTRWFTRISSSGCQVMFAQCWKLVPVPEAGAWNVIKSPFIAHEDHFLHNFPKLLHEHREYGLPDPRKINELIDENSNTCTPWNLTDPSISNCWRQTANGRWVMFFPVWAYCDDTLGNTHKEYNVHFLCTSNLATPLEMLDGIADQFEKAQAKGIEAWDCVLQEDVVVIPYVLALLGDNPMQSEFVMGKDRARAQAARQSTLSEPGDGNNHGSLGDRSDDDGSNDGDEDEEQSDDETSDNSTTTHQKGHRKNRGPSRERQETMHALNSMFDMAKTLGNEGHIKKRRTMTGLKDTYQLFFLDRIFTSYKKFKSKPRKEEVLKSTIRSFPENLTSPVWCIRGLDPHQDTLVEILHVVLLGFLKYIWRDVIQYCGSLTGRDFRSIAQVAPFVLHGLVGKECYEAWLSLSKLVPLIWLPEIEDIETYTTLLEHEIDTFLLRIARWMCQWFNKPKFHILLHLPAHIRCFGPAMLFATEAFKSFNAVICVKSVHSNRLSPSWDIARAFAQGNHVRHLLSSGYFNTRTRQADGTIISTRRRPGPGSLRLVSTEGSTIAHYLGIEEPSRFHPGMSVNDDKPSHPYTQTLTGQIFPNLELFRGIGQHHWLAKTAKKLVLLNCDSVQIDDHVIIRNIHGWSMYGSTWVGRIAEILRLTGSNTFRDVGLQQPDCILVEVLDISSEG
ncbi:hypothetical protein EV421DRAFT_1987087 [Armillaria borealis]|uniref:Uncharacterized protein n=1 Tax=Armillaria borealis TaxID=47425 RepID=A0AA39MIC7_9AGAR|nr:hypothetical protein EV421DRAFT_1987087 [Armillaria borealis]